MMCVFILEVNRIQFLIHVHSSFTHVCWYLGSAVTVHAIDTVIFISGLGLLMVLISFDILWYYVVIMGWIQYFFVNSFFPELPWSTCGNWWNTPNCVGMCYSI